MARKLYRSATNRMMWGVCGGLADYFEIDPVLIRVIFVVLALASGVGILLYIILAIAVPSGQVPTLVSPEGINVEEEERRRQEGSRGRKVAGAIVIALGVVFLLSNLNMMWWFRWDVMWPVLLIAFGAALLLGRSRR